MNRYSSSAAMLLLALPVPGILPALAEEGADSPEAPVVAASAVIPNVDIQADIEDVPEDNLQRLFRLYMEARNADMYDEAEVLAKQIVEYSIQAFGFLSRQTAHALTDLGELQTSNGDYHAAVLNLVSAVEIIEQIDNRLSISLVSPLRALGEAHYRSGNPDVAMLSWNRAVHVSHVNLGPHNFDQVETLVNIGQVLKEAEQYKKANKIRRRINYLSQRSIDETSRPDSIPAADDP